MAVDRLLKTPDWTALVAIDLACIKLPVTNFGITLETLLARVILPKEPAAYTFRLPSGFVRD